MGRLKKKDKGARSAKREREAEPAKAPAPAKPKAAPAAKDKPRRPVLEPRLTPSQGVGKATTVVLLLFGLLAVISLVRYRASAAWVEQRLLNATVKNLDLSEERKEAIRQQAERYFRAYRSGEIDGARFLDTTALIVRLHESARVVEEGTSQLRLDQRGEMLLEQLEAELATAPDATPDASPAPE